MIKEKCIGCGKEFIKTRHNKKYCSRDEAYRLERRRYKRKAKRNLKNATLTNLVSYKYMIRFCKTRPPNTVSDHIIPIRHPLVCGLNVPWNIQFISNEENIIKSNDFDFTYENNSWRSKLIKS